VIHNDVSLSLAFFRGADGWEWEALTGLRRKASSNNELVHYIPIWDVSPVQWTDAAIAAACECNSIPRTLCVRRHWQEIS
jgi:hypothetical protein